ncbi:hypothetical protein [Actinoplanes sp. N902-109]|uniref:hypothetical protein n=1 Tax=Actinoplanes sp. (strain N902-109) TaxID=649831 RepID=UPI0003294CB4|nr:hypothetical protein [Actinoplanes sp. N902-109]AGL14844.1 hypothetical protein L083_1334 [Actinoplanes sp. N902-109]
MFRLLIVVITALLAGACSPADEAPPPATPSPSVAADNPPGALACAKVIAAADQATIMTPGVADAVLRAATTADAPVADAARRLADAYAAAVAAKGAADEPDRVAAVSAATADMVQVCRDSGLEAVG